MLEFRPNCENCNKKLAADSIEAMICSYECTYCQDCVNTVSHNVCPSCGGGFVARAIRPKNNLKGDNYLGKDPASRVIKHNPVDETQHQLLIEKIKDIAPHLR